MRIVAGELRGRRLASLPVGSRVRPTSDRAREALFSILGDITGLHVLDLFCGTGALGIEALSRGAAPVTLVDTDARPAAANIEALGLGERVELLREDALTFLRRTTETYDLITCDPPYDEAPSLASGLAGGLPARVAAGGRVVVETASTTPMPLDLIGFHLERERRYGGSLLRIWRNDE